MQRDSGVGAREYHIPPAPAAAGTKESKGSSSGCRCESMEGHTQVYSGKLQCTPTQTSYRLGVSEVQVTWEKK